MIVGRLADTKLRKDVPHMPLDGLGAQEESLADALVRAALGHQGEHLAFTLGELAERAGWAGPAQQPGHDRRVDHALALVHASQRVSEHTHAGHALLEQVTGPARVLFEEPHRVVRLKVVGQDEHPDIRMRRADFLGGDEALIGVGGRHLDIDDRDVGAGQLDFAAQLLGRARLADDVEAGLGQQAIQPVPEKHLVVRDHHTHGISARSFVRPSGPCTTATQPSSAPTRSSRSMISAGALSPSTSTTRRPLRRAAETLSVLAAPRLTASDTTKYAAISTEEPSRSCGSVVIYSGIGTASASASTAADNPSSASITGKIPCARSRRSARAARNSASAWSMRSATAGSRSRPSLERARRSASESVTSRCWAPSCRSRTSRRRTASPDWTIRPRDARRSSNWRRASAWRRSLSSASRAVAATSSASAGSANSPGRCER